jgi:hypothetical protein
MHTVQTQGAYNELAETGTLRPDPSLAWPEFAEPYRWMLEQMNQRLSTSGNGMVWLWARISWRDLVDQLRRARGEVLVTVRIPRDRILLSAFDDWHVPLNRGLYVPSRPDESVDAWWSRAGPLKDAFDARVEAAGFGQTPLDQWDPELRHELESSRVGIFDPANWPRGCIVQATVHELRAEDVVSATRIRVRNGPRRRSFGGMSPGSWRMTGHRRTRVQEP